MVMIKINPDINYDSRNFGTVIITDSLLNQLPKYPDLGTPNLQDAPIPDNIEIPFGQYFSLSDGSSAWMHPDTIELGTKIQVKHNKHGILMFSFMKKFNGTTYLIHNQDAKNFQARNIDKDNNPESWDNSTTQTKPKPIPFRSTSSDSFPKIMKQKVIPGDMIRSSAAVFVDTNGIVYVGSINVPENRKKYVQRYRVQGQSRLREGGNLYWTLKKIED